jgi:5-formyltetrahydrofolate cyclo-ligase
LNQKAALRTQIRAARRALPPDQQRRAADSLVRHVSRLPCFVNSQRIALYYPDNGEIDPTGLLQLAWSMKKSCYLPVLHHVNGNRLRFALVRPGTRLVKNRYGIPEPEHGPRQWLMARQLDLILLPLVAFDAQANRLGMGGGYYDLTLSFLRHRSLWKRPRLLGAAHELQKVDRLTTEPWDVPLDGVVTDKALYRSPGP